MPKLEATGLRRDLGRLARQATAAVVAPPVELLGKSTVHIEMDADGEPPKSRLGVYILVTAGVFLLAGLMLSQLREPERMYTSAGDSGWQVIAASPLGPREGAASAWTGSELLVWGGSTFFREGDDFTAEMAEGSGDPALDGVVFSDGAAYDPATDSWRRIPDGILSPRTRAVGAWTGSEFIVIGGQERQFASSEVADGAAFDPQSSTWRGIEPAPFSPLDALWTGDEVLIWSATELATWDPVTDTWIERAALPAEADNFMAYAWTGEDLVIQRAEIHQYNVAADAWSTLPPVTDRLGGNTSLGWTGTQLIGVQHGEGTSTFDPDSRSWSRVAGNPPTSKDFPSRSYLAGVELIFPNLTPAPYHFNTANQQWTGGPALSIDRLVPSIAWTGTELLVVGGRSSDLSATVDDGLSYRP